MNDIFSFPYERLHVESLAGDMQHLIGRAREALGSSYAPYSGFRVGVSCLLHSGEIFTASNQESEVFPSGMCAERTLLYYLQSNRADDPICTLVLVSSPGENICTPCGTCRQVLADTEKRQGHALRILMCSDTEVISIASVELLLPFSFSLT